MRENDSKLLYVKIIALCILTDNLIKDKLAVVYFNIENDLFFLEQKIQIDCNYQRNKCITSSNLWDPREHFQACKEEYLPNFIQNDRNYLFLNPSPFYKIDKK